MVLQKRVQLISGPSAESPVGTTFPTFRTYLKVPRAAARLLILFWGNNGLSSKELALPTFVSTLPSCKSVL